MRVLAVLMVLALAGCSIPDAPPPSAAPSTTPQARATATTSGSSATAEVAEPNSATSWPLPQTDTVQPRSMESLGYRLVERVIIRNRAVVKVPSAWVKEEVFFDFTCPTTTKITMNLLAPKVITPFPIVHQACEGAGGPGPGVRLPNIDPEPYFVLEITGNTRGAPAVAKIYAK